MKIKRSLAKEGDVLAEDIFSMTNHPIMNKHTVLTARHLSVLDRFLIEEIDILRDTVKTEKREKESMRKKEEQNSHEIKDDSFVSIYLQAVKKYKLLFENWRAGALVSILDVRNTIFPAVLKGMDDPRSILMLHHYTKAKEYIYFHAISVAVLSAFLGKRLKLSRGDCLQLALAGALIDCGMAKVSSNLLHKEGPLTSEEMKEIKQHTIMGYNMLKKAAGIKEAVLLGVLQHHEREDGSGYPLGSKGDHLHIFSKILAVSDVYLAMTEERPYRDKQSGFKVLEMMMNDQFGCFDHRVLNSLIDSLSIFSVGTQVKLTNQEIGEIVFIEQAYPTRPMIKLKTSQEIIALKNRRDLFIEEILS
ncbi:HD-GYP domain-containing protein [Fictibacillus sp. Mic-4]|uniref:HD-GYP domain-containing protein n=1 Tax=Fictibacillus sp. Mic-4 TaxID=3132826 RepID=UPI003CFB2090